MVDDIARKIKNKERMGIREVRLLADRYLDTIALNKKLDKKILDLSGGEIARVEVSDTKRNWSVFTFKRRNGSGAAYYSMIEKINKLIQSLGNVSVGSLSYYRVVTGPAAKVEKFLELNEIITTAIQDAYNAGFNDGADMLNRLASGDVSMNEFNEATMATSRDKLKETT